jgi:anaerobic magnesium-protoporphyrin IX monomethyl ester cyclase
MKKNEVTITLIYPPSSSQTHGSCPMGILMVGTILKKAGYCVQLIDANANNNRLSFNEVINIACASKPSIIGMTLLTPIIKEAYVLAEKFKSLGYKLLAGGPHASIIPEEPLNHGFDTVVIGEAEMTVVETIEALLAKLPLEKIKGIAYKNSDGKTTINEPRDLIVNLDELPFPDWDLVNLNNYEPTNGQSLSENIFSSRGCPAKCAYCSGSLFGKRFRFRSAQNVLQEIFQMHKTRSIKHFHFVDDSMAMNKERTTEICQGLIDSKLPITWSMMTRIDSVDEKLLELAFQSGCNRIDYGVESGNRETLRKIHKPHTLEMVNKVVPLTLQYGIQPSVFFILGFPWDTLDSTNDTFQLIKDLSPYVDIYHTAVASILVPFPGTEIYEKYKDEFGFHDWWLSADYGYDAPKLNTHSYFETALFSLGAVLDAGFFNYSIDVKKRIYKVFKYMYIHNQGKESITNRIKKRMMLELSERLFYISPHLEKMIFQKAYKVLKG